MRQINDKMMKKAFQIFKLDKAIEENYLHIRMNKDFIKEIKMMLEKLRCKKVKVLGELMQFHFENHIEGQAGRSSKTEERQRSVIDRRL